VREGDHQGFTTLLKTTKVRLEQADIAVENARCRKAAITKLSCPVTGRQRVLLKAID